MCVCGEMENTWRMALIIPINTVAVSVSKVKSTATVKPRFLADETKLMLISSRLMVLRWSEFGNFLLSPFHEQENPCFIIVKLQFVLHHTIFDIVHTDLHIRLELQSARVSPSNHVVQFY